MAKRINRAIELLENDQPIPGQNYVCLSFVSPNSLIEKRENFYMQEFYFNFKLIINDFATLIYQIIN